MFCPVLEHEIQAHKKAAEIARELSRTGYCYIENGYWSDTYNAALEQYRVEPVINNSIL